MAHVSTDPDGTIVIEHRPVLDAVFTGALFAIAIYFGLLGWINSNVKHGLLFAVGVPSLWLLYGRHVRFTRLLLRPDGSAALVSRSARGRLDRAYAPGTLHAEAEHGRCRSGETIRAYVVDGSNPSAPREPLTSSFGSEFADQPILDKIHAWRERTAPSGA